jgi:glycosyltransferase 2 family protein
VSGPQTEAEQPPASALRRLRGRFLVSLGLGVLVVFALSAYADFSAVLSGLGDFKWQYLPLVLLLSSLNYVLRFFKWEFYLKTIGVHGFSRRQSLLTYLAGLGMVVTPGKIGEWLKCYLLRELHGTPFSKSAPIPMAERLTDSLGLVILGAAGLVVFGNAWPAFVVVVVGGGVLVLLARNRALAHRVLGIVERLPVLSRFGRQAEQFYDSSYHLLAPLPLGAMTLLSVVSWGFEVLGFYFVLVGLGLDGNAELLLKASFIMPAATLASALLLTPGGLGVAEGGITGLSQVLLNLPRAQAAVGALIIRFGTLWFGVIVGLTALAILSREFDKAPAVADALTPSTGGASEVP